MNPKYRMKMLSATSVRSMTLALFKRSIALSALVVVLALSGCSGAPASGSVVKEATAKTETSDGQNRQNAFVRPDIMGEVKSIVGNSITIALAKVPTRDMTGAGTGQGFPPADGQMPSGPPPDVQGGGNFQPPAGGNADGGQRQQGAQGGPGVPGAQGTQARAPRAMNLTLTGETKDIMIPVGIEIMSGMGDAAKVVDIADIKKGDTIMIYYATGTENIEKITIR